MIDMQISDAGIDLIRQFEGYCATPYKDIAGIETIGIGHRIKPGESFTTLDLLSAVALLKKDVSYAESAICQAVSVELTQYEYDALCSFVYNVGGKLFLGSTLLKNINDEDMAAAADEFLKWDKVHIGDTLQVSDGLLNRRKAERAMFLGEA